MTTRSPRRAAPGLQPIPDGLVVLTFDDGCKSDAEFVAPLLKTFGFGATFFINHPGLSPWNREHHMTWDQIAEIHEAGFEIGNHTAHHPDVSGLSRQAFVDELEQIERGCSEHGIPRPVMFCYPGFRFGRTAVEALRDNGYRFARRGIFPERRERGRGGRGPAYDPRTNHPLLIPTTGYSGPDWSFDDLVWAVDQARGGRITVLCFHGVPDIDHSWVHTGPKDFQKYVQHLRDRGCTVIAMRDLARYVDCTAPPNDPLALMEKVIE